MAVSGFLPPEIQVNQVALSWGSLVTFRGTGCYHSSSWTCWGFLARGVWGSGPWAYEHLNTRSRCVHGQVFQFHFFLRGIESPERVKPAVAYLQGTVLRCFQRPLSGVRGTLHQASPASRCGCWSSTAQGLSSRASVCVRRVHGSHGRGGDRGRMTTSLVMVVIRNITELSQRMT